MRSVQRQPARSDSDSAATVADGRFVVRWNCVYNSPLQWYFLIVGSARARLLKQTKSATGMFHIEEGDDGRCRISLENPH